MRTLRWLMLAEAASLAAAATLHSGLVTGGPGDRAAIFEASLAVVLGVGLAVTLAGPGAARVAALATQGLTLAGASVGFYLALRGIAPNTIPDIAYHVALIGVLLVGIGVARRLDATPAPVARA